MGEAQWIYFQGVFGRFLFSPQSLNLGGRVDERTREKSFGGRLDERTALRKQCSTRMGSGWIRGTRT